MTGIMIGRSVGHAGRYGCWGLTRIWCRRGFSLSSILGAVLVCAFVCVNYIDYCKY
jgi:hypothetical protein